VAVSLPNGTAENVYTNYAGEVMGMSIAPTGAAAGLLWDTGYVYDGQGRLTLTAMPSAIGIMNPAFTDLIGKVTTGNYTGLYDASGLLDQTVYAPAGGANPGFATATNQLHGDGQLITGDEPPTGSALVPMSSMTYVAQTVNASTIYLLVLMRGRQPMHMTIGPAFSRAR
jgi:hypothetical protein